MRSYKSAFTLIELMVVISIISLLSSVVLSSLNSARDKARIAAGIQFEANLYHTIGNNLVAKYDFEEGTGSIINDSSGNNITGTLSRSNIWSSDTSNKNSHTSINFTNDNDGAVLSNTFGITNSNFTIALWIKTTIDSEYIREKYTF